MQSNNPVFNRSGAFSTTAGAQRVNTPSAEQLDQMYAAPSATAADTGRMTYDDVVVKTGLTLGTVVAGAVIGWNLLPQMPGLFWPGLIAMLVLGLVNAFKKQPSPALILTYAVVTGVVVGVFSVIITSLGGANAGNLVSQAVLATLCVSGAALWAYKSCKVRVTPKFQRMLMIWMLGYGAFILVNLGFMLFTDTGTFGFRSGILGVVVGLLAVGLAAMCLVMDFDFIDRGVKAGIPEKFAWTAAFGLTVTLVWMYMEILRLLAILQGE